MKNMADPGTRGRAGKGMTEVSGACHRPLAIAIVGSLMLAAYAVPTEQVAGAGAGQMVLRCPDPCRSAITPGTTAREREPMLATDPSDPAHLVIAAQEPPNGIAYVSRDSGSSWTRATLPPTMGSTIDHGADASQFMSNSVALVLRSGTVLYAAIAGEMFDQEFSDGLFVRAGANLHLDVARSDDGGLTYATFSRVATGHGPATINYVDGQPFLISYTQIPDKPWLTEGPDGTVLIVWTHSLYIGTGDLLWSVSRDDGRNWTPPAVVSGAEHSKFINVGGAPIIGSDGTWYVSYIAYPVSTELEDQCCFGLMMARSRDEGATWERSLLDPRTGDDFAHLGILRGEHGDLLFLAYTRWIRDPDLVTDPVCFVLTLTLPCPLAVPLLAWSDDGGRTWSEVALDEPTELGSVNPALAVADDGTAYVSLYHYTAADRMERWLMAVKDGAVAAQLRLDGGIPGPSEAAGDPLGDYMGVAALPDGAYNVWVNLNEHENRDLYGARVRWVDNQPPLAAGGASAHETDRLTPVQFTDRSHDPDGTIVAWQWDFGDGTTSTAQHPSHTFSQLGTFRAQLTVTDNDGTAGMTVLPTIAVINLPPLAAGTADRTETDRLTSVGFTDASIDPDGAVLAWTWDFGDGATSHDRHPSHTYTRLGTFSVQLTVADNDGDTATAEVARIKVKNLPPLAANSHGSEGNRVDPLSFEDESTDPDGTIVAWQWDFGDGAGSAEPNPGHQYGALGTFPVTLTVTDDDGATAQRTTQVTVVNLPPSLNFATNPLRPKAWTLTHFLDDSTDRDGSIVSWAWDFGDGGSAADATASHRFLEGGLRTVRLVGTDNEGATAELLQTIFVCQPGVDHHALVEPGHVRLEFRGCIEANEDPQELLGSQLPDPADPAGYLGVGLPLEG